MDSQQPITMLTDANFKDEALDCKGPVLVEFEAQWSGPCYILAPVMEVLATEFRDHIKVCRLDVDRCPAVSLDYGVSTLPTLLFFKGGEAVDVLVGAVARDEIESRIRSLIEPEA